MKTILILLVILSLPLMAATKTTQVQKVGPDTDPSLPVEEMNTSPNPVPQNEDNNRDQSLINGSVIQEQEEAPALESGPYDKDGQYTFPKKDTTEETP